MKLRTDGLFTKCEHPSDEMREKIRKGVKRSWKTRYNPAKEVADARSKIIDKWLTDELEKLKNVPKNI